MSYVAEHVVSFAPRPGAEVRRQMQICNACRYCEGLCAVFPAMERRGALSDVDIDHLANLCHRCGACYYDCQYAPPHEFAVNIPVALGAAREQSYAHYAWPPVVGTVFERQAIWVAITCVLAIAGLLLGFAFVADPGALFAADAGPGAFYRIMPHELMVALFGGAFAFAGLSTLAGLIRFWRAHPTQTVTGHSVWHGVRDALSLKNLRGGGMGCATHEDERNDRRRLFHHFTAGGFVLCFLATSVATLMHYGMNWPAPYPWYSPPVVLGVVGGLGIVIGPLGLMRIRSRLDANIAYDDRLGASFLWMLLLIGVTGLALLMLRSTSLMQILLAVHLGFVFAWFLLLPYSKFVHGLYRLLALVRDAAERRQNG